jgi:DNA-binding transcriptional MerR regulator
MTQLTIGQLAERTGVSRSALRYYEEQGLIKPAARTGAGYRLYDTDTADKLLFIQRAQRLGFSLADIGAMLQHAGDSADPAIAEIAEHRYLEIERQLTDLLVQRHEMGSFLRELADVQGDIYQRLIDRVCGHDHGHQTAATATLQWLLHRTGCKLATSDVDTALAPLLGRHIHIWRDGDEYRVLVPGSDPAIERALRAIAALEAECHAHAAPRLERTAEGYVFVAKGENAFSFAQLFLDMESTVPHRNA